MAPAWPNVGFHCAAYQRSRRRFPHMWTVPRANHSPRCDNVDASESAPGDSPQLWDCWMEPELVCWVLPSFRIALKSSVSDRGHQHDF
jgi:hypothetical protein